MKHRFKAACCAIVLFCLNLAGSGAAAQAVASHATSIWLSPDLELDGGKTIQVALTEPFEQPYEVTLNASLKSAHKTLHNCLDYLPIERSISDAGPTVVSNVLHFQGARCDALDLLRSARPAAHPFFDDFSFRHLTTADLPPGLALIPNEQEQHKADRITSRGGSIADLEKRVTLRPKSRYEAELSIPAWTATLTVLAHADFLGDGTEQLLIRRNAAAIGGSLRTTTIFLLGRATSTTPFRILRTRP